MASLSLRLVSICGGWGADKKAVGVLVVKCVYRNNCKERSLFEKWLNKVLLYVSQLDKKTRCFGGLNWRMANSGGIC